MGRTLTPGEHGILNDRCPWPERRGLLATVMRTDGCGHVYPVHGLRPVDVVIFVHEDPLQRESGPDILPNGVPWSCVVTRDCLDLYADRRDPAQPDGPGVSRG